VIVSNEQPPVRKVIPYKSGKRPSTFRRLNIDFAGTALEEALNEQEQREQDITIQEIQTKDSQTEVTNTLSPPVTTSHHHSPVLIPQVDTSVGEANIKEVQRNQRVPQTPHIEMKELPLVTTTPQENKKSSSGGIAPERDFNRRANSLERDALPSGLFPGSTKKVYDALYLRTLGAIIPVKRIKASRRDLLTWTGIRNLKTIDNHIRYLMAKGLIIRHWELGSNEGSSYEVRLPEELQDQSPPLPTTGGHSPPDTTSQNLGIPTTQKMGSGGEGQSVVNAATYTSAKTSFKTNTERSDDDDATALAAMIRTLKNATKEITGKESSLMDGDRWNELAEVLVAELKIAAARTTVSSVPAFLAEHLRRRLWKIDKKQARAEGRELPDEAVSQITNIDASACPDCSGSGWWYPEGEGKGVAKCKHANLRQNS
jgi:hypothetical protein